MNLFKNKNWVWTEDYDLLCVESGSLISKISKKRIRYKSRNRIHTWVFSSEEKRNSEFARFGNWVNVFEFDN